MTAYRHRNQETNNRQSDRPSKGLFKDGFAPSNNIEHLTLNLNNSISPRNYLLKYA